MKITDTVYEIVKDAVERLGYELYEVQYQKEDGNMVLTLFIDSPNGITLDDCESVSRTVDPLLDEADPISEPYYLSVSSLGLDRPIKSDRDFARNLDVLVTAKLYAAVNKKKEFLGKLVSYDEESYTLEITEKGRPAGRMTFKRRDTALLRPYIEF